MNTPEKNRQKTLWVKAKISLMNYQHYLKRKVEEGKKFQLTIIDLFYISNFKGGNASIHEDENRLAAKLENYSAVLRMIAKDFSGKLLVELSQPETETLIDYSKFFFDLCRQDNTPIDGFKSSFLSALLHAHFPDLFPVLDRRVLINSGVITNQAQLDKSGQVKNISTFYDRLIREFQKNCQTSGQSLRQLDEYYFIMPLPDWTKAKPGKT